MWVDTCPAPRILTPANARAGRTIQVPSEFPDWAEQLDAPARYKILYGGRGSAKSHTIAGKLVLLGAIRQELILCTRELQKSIRDSVMSLLKAKIDAMGLRRVYKYGRTYIECKTTGTEFLFHGLRHNAEEIKSLEGVTRCWVEEAAKVSNDSWELLIPTIRTPGSEFWISYNPNLITDATHVRFVLNTPPDSVLIRANYTDNPWFPQVLENERLYMLRTDPEAHEHVWGGACRRSADDEVLRGKWRVDAFDSPDWKTVDGPYFGVDWGFSEDPMGATRSYIKEISGDPWLFVDYEAWKQRVENKELGPFLEKNIPKIKQGRMVRADNARPEHISQLQGEGWNISGAEKWPGSVEAGINYLRGFAGIVIHQRCAHLQEEARLWRHKKDRLTGDVLTDLVPGNDHLWDSVRYAHGPMIRQTTHGQSGAAGTVRKTRR